MGVGGISIWQLLIILVIVLLLFGTKKLRGMGGDLGASIKSFRKSMKEESEDEADADSSQEQLEDDSVAQAAEGVATATKSAGAAEAVAPDDAVTQKDKT